MKYGSGLRVCDGGFVGELHDRESMAVTYREQSMLDRERLCVMASKSSCLKLGCLELEGV